MTKRLVERLCHKMANAGYSSYMMNRAQKYISELQQRGVHCVDRFIRKLLANIDDKEAYLDILMEGRFAVLLAKISFQKSTLSIAMQALT